MLNIFLTIVSLLPIVAVVCGIWWFVSQLPKMSTDRLKKLCSNPRYINLALDELSKREENIDFSFPILYNLAVSVRHRRTGWRGLRRHFPEFLIDLGINIESKEPTYKAIEALKAYSKEYWANKGKDVCSGS